MNGGVAIFVKTPGLSPVKTRLAAGIGAAAAEQWHRLAAAAVAAVTMHVPGLTPYWAVAEPGAAAAAAWPGLPHIQQGAGELGARMGRVHEALLEHHDFGLLLGADTPQLSPQALLDAAHWLSETSARLAMGPARDGGFWLLGANRSLPPAAWVAHPCGQPDTAHGYIRAMEQHGEWRFLPTLTDVDEARDLAAMLTEFDGLQAPLAEQAQVAKWSREAGGGAP
jgi:uncharacterized protein